MQRGFRGKNCLQKAKIYHSKTVEKSIISRKNKNFLKKCKKSVAKIVRLFCATLLKINRSLFPYRPIATDDIKPSVLPADREKTNRSLFSNQEIIPSFVNRKASRKSDIGFSHKKNGRSKKRRPNF